LVFALWYLPYYLLTPLPHTHTRYLLGLVTLLLPTHIHFVNLFVTTLPLHGYTRLYTRLRCTLLRLRYAHAHGPTRIYTRDHALPVTHHIRIYVALRLLLFVTHAARLFTTFTVRTPRFFGLRTLRISRLRTRTYVCVTVALRVYVAHTHHLHVATRILRLRTFCCRLPVLRTFWFTGCTRLLRSLRARTFVALLDLVFIYCLTHTRLYIYYLCYCLRLHTRCCPLHLHLLLQFTFILIWLLRLHHTHVCTLFGYTRYVATSFCCTLYIVYICTFLLFVVTFICYLQFRFVHLIYSWLFGSCYLYPLFLPHTHVY